MLAAIISAKEPPTYLSPFEKASGVIVCEQLARIGYPDPTWSQIRKLAIALADANTAAWALIDKASAARPARLAQELRVWGMQCGAGSGSLSELEVSVAQALTLLTYNRIKNSLPAAIDTYQRGLALLPPPAPPSPPTPAPVATAPTQLPTPQPVGPTATAPVPVPAPGVVAPVKSRAGLYVAGGIFVAVVAAGVGFALWRSR